MHAALGDPHRLAVVDLLAHSDRSPGYLATATGLEPNLIAHHLRVLERAGVVEVRRSEGDGRRRYVRLLDTAAAQPTTMPDQPVVFVCTHNSARSQLAEALWRTRVGGSVSSAGTHPAPAVHPLAAAVARERGLNGVAAAVPREIGSLDGVVVVSVCDRAAEELAQPDLHWSIPDPVAVGTDAAFVAAFDAIEAWVDRTQRKEP